MRVTAAISVISAMCLAQSVPQLTEVFSGTSIVDYNSWLHESSAQHPGIPPVRVTLRASGSGPRAGALRADFFDIDGNRVSSLQLAPDGAHVQRGGVSYNQDRLVVVRSPLGGSSSDRSTTVYGSAGESMFSFRGGYLRFAEGGLYFRGNSGDMVKDYISFGRFPCFHGPFGPGFCRRSVRPVSRSSSRESLAA